MKYKTCNSIKKVYAMQPISAQPKPNH